MTTRPQTKDSRRGELFGSSVLPIEPIQPALADIPDAIAYLGRPSRSKFYADILPKLDVVKLGARTMVTIESLDRLIVANRRNAGE